MMHHQIGSLFDARVASSYSTPHVAQFAQNLTRGHPPPFEPLLWIALALFSRRLLSTFRQVPRGSSLLSHPRDASIRLATHNNTPAREDRHLHQRMQHLVTLYPSTYSFYSFRGPPLPAMTPLPHLGSPRPHLPCCRNRVLSLWLQQHGHYGC